MSTETGAKRGEHVNAKAAGEGTKAKPWKLKTPSGSSDDQMYRAEDSDPPAIVCVVGKTERRYHLRAIALLRSSTTRRTIGCARSSSDAAGHPVGGRADDASCARALRPLR
jgi:hypothetical protein